MSDENPVNDSEELVDELGTTENETQEEETEALEGDELDNAESEESEVSEEVESTENVPVEKQGGLPKGAQKRIDKLTKKLALQAEQHQRDLQALGQQKEQTQKFLDAPTPENLENMSQQEQVQHHVNRNLAQTNINNLDVQTQQAVASHKAKIWQDKIDDRLEDLPDFHKVVNEMVTTVKLSQQSSNDLLEYIDGSDLGVDLAYHLGKNPEIANSLEGLSTRMMDNKLRRLEDKLEAQIKQPTKLSKAKAPISKKGGAVPKQKLSSNTRDFWKNVGAKG